MRQLTNSAGQVTLARSYQPYGNVLSSAGTGISNYGFAGEFTDASGLIHLRARYYGSQWGRFITRDPFPGAYTRPASLHPYMYGYNNPMLYTDPSGKLIPPPMPRICWFGVDPTTGVCKDPFGLPPIFAYASTGSMGSFGPGAIAIGGICLVGLLTYGAYRLVTQSRPVTWGDLLRLPEPQPTKVVVLPTLQPQPTATDETRHTFFFSDVGPYSPRDTSEIVADLQMYGLPGMAGSVSQLISAQNSYDRGATWMIDILMGRKFEAERAIFFADRGALVQMNVSAPHYDLITRNFGPIQYVEVKWSRGPMPIDTILDVVESAGTHPSGTYLVESNNIDEEAHETLEEHGGIELPYPYP